MCHVIFEWGLLIQSHHSAKFGVQQALWKWRYNVFYLSWDHDMEVPRDFLGGVRSS